MKKKRKKELQAMKKELLKFSGGKACAKRSVGGTMLLLVYFLLVQSVVGRVMIEQEVSVAGELNVGKLNKPLMQELREIDMGNFLDPPNIFRHEHAAVGEDKVTVHLVSHSHMDVGWLKTVDQCYFGANNTIQRAGCQYILDTVVAALAIDKRRKFTYAEQAFFQRWYEEQTEDMKNVVRSLVKDKQLIFVDGGWAQHDEGCLHFTTMIDQTTFGSQFLMEEFGITPSIGWHLDPFGHTSTQASLLTADVGFDAFYFARIDYQDRIHRRQTGTMEMLWRASPSLRNEIFSGAFVQGAYCSPAPFNWGYSGGSGVPHEQVPIMDDPRMENNNIDANVEYFVHSAREYQTYSKGRNVLMMMGCDYKYENAFEWYRNLDRLIDAVNKDGRVHAMYSDPETYTAAKHDENLTWTVKTDDFIPCAQDWSEESGLRGHMYWSGYFTSRPALKYYQRYSSGFLQTARQLQALARLPIEPSPQKSWSPLPSAATAPGLNPLSAAVALVSHHDAVTGTARQHVTNDYAKHLSLGHRLGDLLIDRALTKLLLGDKDKKERFVLCKLTNETMCSPTQRLSLSNKELVYVVAYNPMGKTRVEQLRVPISSSKITPDVVLLSTGKSVSNVIVLPSTQWASDVQKNALNSIPVDEQTLAPYVLVFDLELPPLGYQTVSIKFSEQGNGSSEQVDQIKKPEQGLPIVLENELVKVEFDPVSGMMESIQHKPTGIHALVSQGFYYYSAENSGPWMLRPDQTSPEHAMCVGKCNMATSVQVVHSPLSPGKVIEVIQTFDDWVTQTARLLPGQDTVELEWTVGPVPLNDNVSKEVFSRFRTDIKSGDKWRVDSNCYEITSRRLNHRDTFNLTVTEPIAGNVVNVNSVIMVEDNERSFMVMNDRSQGGVSLRPGEIDLFLQRRLLGFDYPGGGMGPSPEPLNETRTFEWGKNDVAQGWIRQGPGVVIRGKHRVGVTAKKSSARMYRNTHHSVFRAPLLAFDLENSEDPMPYSHVNATSLRYDLPENVHVVSFQQRKQTATTTTFLLRLMHAFSVEEDSILSKPVTLSLQTLFSPAGPIGGEIIDVAEWNLVANQPKSDMKKPMRWHTSNEYPPLDPLPPPPSVVGPDYNVLLTPLKIRTFFVTFGGKK